MNILETCAICLENKKFKKTFIELNCGHKFHKNCLETWFKTAVSCPLCRKDCLDLDRIPYVVEYENDEIDFDIDPSIKYTDIAWLINRLYAAFYGTIPS
jgi:hypothetical protein